MQLQFEKQPIQYLQTIKRETQSQEQTQEVRITDAMPDIGTIIGAWGQVVLRGKEWQADGMTISGGTMVWVEYVPEEGGQPQCVESWLPFQMRWPFPATQHDGTIFAQCCLCGVDARSTSARKMIIRTNVLVLAWAMEQQTLETYTPKEIPQDVQLRKETYPLLLPAEAGEKAFSLEDTFALPPSAPRLEKVMYYCLQPEITEEKLMGDKVVFRGNAVLHILYCAEDGGQYSWDFDLPFTQYAELDREYGEHAQIMLLPCVTALEIEREEDKLNLKAGLVCQYRICEKTLLEVVTDAYSTRRSVELIRMKLDLPGILDTKTQNLYAQVTCPMDGMRLTDVQFQPKGIHIRSNGEERSVELFGQFQMLYYDMNGELRTTTQKWEETVSIPVSDGCQLEAIMSPVNKSQGSFMAGNAQMSAQTQLVMQTINGAGIPVVTGMELGELQEPNPHRPSLVLVQPGDRTLWQLAKENGSTVALIRDANDLCEELNPDKIVMIPIL